ncbi:uncharacterized protein LOC100834432 [Brachypodium distachyon]|nr:uncharacterized protein LOC100834432 [Brachypodium distachyon]|eukprot:XP_014758725.1 uncharacterized protein LOC100834432 [Brachypodium distachyon]
MADAIFSAVVGDMVGRVISLLAGHYKAQRFTEAKLRRISHMLIKVHSAIEEAKGRQITNHGTLDWLTELNDGVYQGRYFLDTVGCGREPELEKEEDELAADHNKVAAKHFSLSLFNPAKRVRVAACTVKSLLLPRQDVDVDKNIDRVVEILEMISGDIKEFLMLLQNCQPMHRPLTTNIFMEGQMFGRHVEKERIINFLLQADDGSRLNNGNLGVLPIVGDMGVGKTTLAQHVCDDPRVRSHFPVIIYSIFSCILAMVRGEAGVVLQSKHTVGDAQNLIESLRVLRENYRSKRFLIVFEDVDMCKKQTMEELLPILRQGKQGSKIIVTTNNRRVARTMGTVDPIILKVMPHAEYWFFFKACAFPGRDVEENPRMVAAGEAIAKKLSGSFFGAKMVGGMLKAHPDRRFWCKVLRSNIGGLSLLGDGIGYIADLAENLLPSHAEMCEVTVSKNPFSAHTELARLEDICQEPPGADSASDGFIGGYVRFARVLLCRSVLETFTMAEAVFSAVVGDVVSRVISLVAGRFGDQQSTDTDAKLKRICRMLIRIHSVVEEAKGRQITNHGALDWLSELNDGVYEGRYLLDTAGCCRDQPELEDHQVAAQPFTLSSFNPAKRIRVAACAVKSILSLRPDAGADEIDRVLESLRSLSGDLREFMMLLQGCKKRIRRPLATNIFAEGQMFGRHVEKERIINFLLHDDDGPLTEKLLVPLLPVVGDIGSGKTTLVQHVCDDARVRSRFPIIMLFNITSTYAMAMGEATVVIRSKHVIGDSGNLKHPLHVLDGDFRKKRFLMVFEDVDMHKKQMLEELLPRLRNGKLGSKIIVTTSNGHVARMGTVEPIKLKALRHPEYWFFFKAHAFAGTDVEEDPRMVAAGKGIARKLNGSFFGAKIVGGVLKARPDPRFWRRVLRSNIGELSSLGDGLGYMADLAENLLPSHVNMRQLIISKKPFSANQPEFAKLHDMFLPSAPNAIAALDSCRPDVVRNEKVLLCRSVLPFYCLYYNAHCTVRG